MEKRGNVQKSKSRDRGDDGRRNVETSKNQKVETEETMDGETSTRLEVKKSKPRSRFRIGDWDYRTVCPRWRSCRVVGVEDGLGRRLGGGMVGGGIEPPGSEKPGHAFSKSLGFRSVPHPSGVPEGWGTRLIRKLSVVSGQLSVGRALPDFGSPGNGAVGLGPSWPGLRFASRSQIAGREPIDERLFTQQVNRRGS